MASANTVKPKDSGGKTLGATAPAAPRRTRERSWWRRLLRDKAAIISMAVLLFFVVVAILAPVIAPNDPIATDGRMRNMPIGTEGFPLGTDQVGRDILSRIIYGARATLALGVIAAIASSSVGMVLGLLAGYFGKWPDTIIMRGVDVLMAFPYILLAIIIVAILGPSLRNAIIAVAVLGVPFYVRIVRAEVLKLRSLDFITAARTLGANDSRILLNHVAPNVIAPIIVTMSLHIGFLILQAAGLSFLGLGAQPPSPEWGAMVASGRDYLLSRPHVVLVPSACIFIVVLALNTLGDGLRDALDPKTGTF